MPFKNKVYQTLELLSVGVHRSVLLGILVNYLSQVPRSQKCPGDFEIGPWNVRETLIQRVYTEVWVETPCGDLHYWSTDRVKTFLQLSLSKDSLQHLSTMILPFRCEDFWDLRVSVLIICKF